MEKTRKVNWTKEEEYTLIEAVQTAGDLLKGTGHSANLNQKKKALWKDMATKLNSIHGNHRDVKDLKKKWNNIKLTAKSHVDDSRREAMRTGGGQNAVGEVEEEQMLILAADKELTTSATERVTQMLGGTPAFSGIIGAVDLFQATSSCPHEEVVDESCLVLESPEQEVLTCNISDGSRKRKRKRSNENTSYRTLSAHDLLPLQHEVLFVGSVFCSVGID